MVGLAGALPGFIPGRAPAKPTKLQPKQGTVATEKERLIYTDPKTGLMWPIDGNMSGKKMNWVDAMIWANKLNYVGYSDWRLPSKAEFEALSKQCGDLAAVWLNSNGFNNVQSDGYWSSSTDSDKTDYAWGVNMSNALIGHFYSKEYNGINVWPVRGFSEKYGDIVVQQNENQKELQKAKEVVARLEAEQKKEIEIKENRLKSQGTVFTVDNRFVFSGLIVKDKRTGLIWARDANLGWQNWHTSFKLIKELNKKRYAGYNDWRVPREKELLTLISYAKSKGYADPSGYSGPSQLFNKMGFYDVQHGHIDYMTGYYYWTSTTGSSSKHARVVSMYNGYAYSEYKGEGHYIWPVRGGK